MAEEREADERVMVRIRLAPAKRLALHRHVAELSVVAGRKITEQELLERLVDEELEGKRKRRW